MRTQRHITPCTLISAFIFSALFSLHLLADRENLFDIQELLKSVIVSFIITTFTFDSSKDKVEARHS